MATAGISTYFLGSKLIVDLGTKHGVRKSPGINKRARAVAKCARNQDLTTRKKCFETGGK